MIPVALAPLVLASLIASASSAEARPASADSLVRRVEEAAASVARWRVGPPDRLQVLRARVEGALPPVAGPVHLALSETRGPNRSGAARVSFRLVGESGDLGAARVTVRGVVRGPAVLARAPLARGSAIGEASLEVAEADLTRLGEPPLREISAAVGRAPRRTLGPGTVLTASLLAGPVLVRRGQPVELRVERDGLTVRARGRARGSGAAGQVILAENEASGALVLAEVQANGSLRVTGRAASRSPR